MRSTTSKETSRGRVRGTLLGIAVAVVASTAFGSGDALAADQCAGLQCGSPGASDFVPEALRPAASVKGLDELKDQQRSGFYEMPALIYDTEAQPRGVAYLSKPGEFQAMPDSVRNLSIVRSLTREYGDKLAGFTIVVINKGSAIVEPGAVSARSSRRGPQARASFDWPYCNTIRVFCLFKWENFEPAVMYLDGPTYVGRGWRNLGTNFGASQENARNGDTLLADHSLGDGTQYCADALTWDATFSNNAIGNGHASSFALLDSTIDRCP